VRKAPISSDCGGVISGNIPRLHLTRRYLMLPRSQPHLFFSTGTMKGCLPVCSLSAI